MPESRSHPRACRYVIPIRREFPIWTFGPLYDRIDGHQIGEGWSPNWFTEREISRGEAERIAEEQAR